MRKFLFVLLVLLLAGISAFALADTVYSLSPAPAQITLREDRVVVTADTLGEHPELMTVIGMSKDDTLADWKERGVVLQAWSAIKTKYSCLEICVLQDDAAARFQDLIHNSSDKAAWKEYMDSYKNNKQWIDAGYTFQSYEQRHADQNGYLLMKYKYTGIAGEHRGYMARTVYRGYTVVFDLKVYNQLPVDQNMNELNRIVKTFADSGAEGLPAVSGQSSEGASDLSGETGTAGSSGAAKASAPAVLIITKAPPRETNTNKFTVEGTTAPGAQVIGVLMKSVGDPMTQRFEAIAHAKNGSFKLNVTIPEAEESAWLMTLNVYESPESDNLIADTVFDFTKYKKTLIPCELDAPVPEEVYSDELVVSGTTMKAVDVQCILTDSSANTIKTNPEKSHPNGTGRFTFKLPLKNEDIYSLTLVITKKNYDEKRLTFTIRRILTDEARDALIRKNAQKVNYDAVAKRADQYIGKTLCYAAWITGIEQVGDEWHITAAVSNTGDHYSNFLLFITEQEPPFSVDEKHTLYGTCRASFQIQSEESIEFIPSFDLLLWD